MTNNLKIAISAYNRLESSDMHLFKALMDVSYDIMVASKMETSEYEKFKDQIKLAIFDNPDDTKFEELLDVFKTKLIHDLKLVD